MENKINSTTDKDLESTQITKSFLTDKKWLIIIAIILILIATIAGLLLVGSPEGEPNTGSNKYRFVNNNAVICSQNRQSSQIDCEDLNDGRMQSIDIPDEYLDSTIQPSHDGKKLLLSKFTEPDKTTIVVTDTNFANPQIVDIPYEESQSSSPFLNVIWGNDSSTLLIAKQIREAVDAEFLPAPLIVWSYDISTAQSKRIFKNGQFEDQSLKLVGASNEYLFVTQPIVKNWVAQSTDSPADSLLAIRLDDGFVRTVSIENIVKIKNVNKYSVGVSISFDPVLSTFYFAGQDQLSNEEYANFYAAAELIENDGLKLRELSRLSSKSQYLGINSTKGTLVADSIDESGELNFSVVASNDEKYDLKNSSSEKDNPKFVIAGLPSSR